MRSTLSCGLVAALLVSQSLCAAHSHVGFANGDDDGREDRPHIHFGVQHAHGHTHGHSHDHVHWHSHESPVDEPLTAPKRPQGPRVYAGLDHDADAFYLGTGVSNALCERGTTSGVVKWNQSPVATLQPPAYQLLASISSSAFRPPPERPRARCALYLLHLAILC